MRDQANITNMIGSPFTVPERELLRRELCRHFGEDPLIADGIFLRTWRVASGGTSQKSRPLCRA